MIVKVKSKYGSLVAVRDKYITKCKKEFGTAWAKIEQGEKVTLNAEQVRKLTRAFDISGYLIFDDYYHRALTWKRIVRLPYGDGQPTI